MINTNNLCMECMKDNGGAEICPYCGYRDDHLQTAPYLTPKTWLMDRYLVGKVMTSDGEGVTYIGWDNILQSAVMVREYLPEGLCERVADTGSVHPRSETGEEYTRCLAAFLERCRALARMRDLSALFPVYDIFELGGTAYAVSEYAESITLHEFLHRNGNALTFEQTRALMMPAVSTIASLHAADIIHGGIAPDTLYVGKDGKLRLGGFATLELRSSQGALKTQLFSGYSAIEQYGFDGKIGPHTDVYSFAACVYRCITGEAPVDVKNRVEHDAFVLPAVLTEKAPDYAVKALTNALQFMPDARTATIERFRAEFSSAPSITEENLIAEAPETESADVSAGKKKNKGSLYTIIAMVATLVVLIALFIGADLKWHIFGIIPNGDAVSNPSVLVISSQESPSVNTSSKLTRKTENFVGQSLTACERNYGSYTFKIDYKKYSEEYAKGVIISQSPEANTEFPLDAEEAQTITVVVSLGSGRLRVPAVEGLTYAEAIEKLWQAGFSYDSITNNTETPAYDGKVTKISPSAGSTCNVYDADIILYVEDPVTSVISVPEAPVDNREVSSVADNSSSPVVSQPSSSQQSNSSRKPE